MRMHAHIIAATVALLTLGGSALNAASPELHALVPFGFSAGSTNLPAGTYTVAQLSGPRGPFVVRSQSTAVMVLPQFGETAPAGKQTRLVFHRYGNRYYLRGVWFTGTSGYSLPETRDERESARGAKETASGPVTVTLVAALG